jgi:hypothetical protein
MTGTDALASAGLDFVSGLRMGLPQIIQMSEILARSFYGWHGNRADLEVAPLDCRRVSIFEQAFCSEGTIENSPAFQCREWFGKFESRRDG